MKCYEFDFNFIMYVSTRNNERCVILVVLLFDVMYLVWFWSSLLNVEKMTQLLASSKMGDPTSCLRSFI